MRQLVPAVLGALLLAALPGLAEEERPLLKIDGSQPAAVPEEDDRRWRGPTRLGGGRLESAKEQTEAKPEGQGHGEEPMAPGSHSAGGPQLKMRYHGVAPGRNELPPRPPKLPLAKGPQRLTWPGFQVREGKPTLFLQLTGAVEYSISHRPGQVILTLHDTVATLRNNLRPLLVQEFGTVVREVRLQRSKKDIVVTVLVRGQVAHTEKMEQAENGYFMLLLTFTPVPGSGEATADGSGSEVDLDDRAWSRPRTLSTSSTPATSAQGGW
ncbi:MAG: hypothetical protein RMK29_05515 [Myxococcales bacterium]|nr:hypothetical protein [Myxococcota bacterium]MDW8281148.1 hypothetical protein [Myxococcales bacterium]